METPEIGTAATRFEIKELAVIMPLLGSGLAIAYEIGSFYPLGYGAFGFFSLTEHLLWALGALPIVLIVLAGAAIGLTVVSLQRSRNALRRRRPDAGRREKRFLRLSAVVLWALGSAGIWSGWTVVVLSPSYWAAWPWQSGSRYSCRATR